MEQTAAIVCSLTVLPEEARSLTERITAGHVHDGPYTHMVVEDLPGPKWSAALAQTFPMAGFSEAGRRGTDAFFRYRHLIRDSRVTPDSWPQVWLDLAHVLMGAEYRAAVGEALGVRLERLKVQAGLCMYGPGERLKPHTDQEFRVVTQTIYFNPGWEESWGGGLRVLGSEDPDDVAREVVPSLGRSMLFVRSDRSWHSVGRVRDDISVWRRSLLLHYHR